MKKKDVIAQYMLRIPIDKPFKVINKQNINIMRKIINQTSNKQGQVKMEWGSNPDSVSWGEVAGQEMIVKERSFIWKLNDYITFKDITMLSFTVYEIS